MQPRHRRMRGMPRTWPGSQDVFVISLPQRLLCDLHLHHTRLGDNRRGIGLSVRRTNCQSVLVQRVESTLDSRCAGSTVNRYFVSNRIDGGVSLRHSSVLDAYCVVGSPPRHPQYLCVGAASSDMLPKELSHTHTYACKCGWRPGGKLTRVGYMRCVTIYQHRYALQDVQGLV